MSDRGVPSRFVPAQGGSAGQPPHRAVRAGRPGPAGDSRVAEPVGPGAAPEVAGPVGPGVAEPDERFAALFDTVSEGVALSTPDGRFTAVNPALRGLFDRLAIDPDAAGPGDLARFAEAGAKAGTEAGTEAPAWEQAVADVVAGRRQVAQLQLRIELPGSPVCWLRATAAQVGLGGRWYLLTLVEDVTRSRRAQQRLVRSVLHDEVTGLANRVLLADRMEAALDRSAHSGVPVGVLHIDLSDAERFATDRMLTEVADRLSPLLRSGDSAGRVGADRFMVIAGDVDAVALADLTGRVHQALAEPLRLDLTGTPARLTAVVGSCLARPGDDLVSVLQRAQAAACVPPAVRADPAEGPS